MSNKGYGEKSYWNSRYGAQDELYDWYINYSTLRDAFVKCLQVKPHVNKTEQQQQQLNTDNTTTRPAPTSDSNTDSTSNDSTPSQPTPVLSSLEDTETDLNNLSTTSLRDRSELKLLNVGCGNSDLSYDLFTDGFTNQVNIDFSPVVVEQMNVRHKNVPGLTYHEMDARDLKYPEREFDVVIDKGTLDAILCGSESAKNAASMLMEVHRVLKRGGLFFLITYGQPMARLPYLERPKYTWTVYHQLIGKSKYMYIMKKGAVQP